MVSAAGSNERGFLGIASARDRPQVLRPSLCQPLHVAVASDDRYVSHAGGGDEKAVAWIATPENCRDIGRFNRNALTRSRELDAWSVQCITKPAGDILSAELRAAMRFQDG
jgi:hypothetical protein